MIVRVREEVYFRLKVFEETDQNSRTKTQTFGNFILKILLDRAVSIESFTNKSEVVFGGCGSDF